MLIKYSAGYTVYQENNEYVWVTPHSGPALEVGTSRDGNSETVASLCWQQLKGKLLVSGVSRKRAWGVDFNRGIPSSELAIKYFSVFKKDIKGDKLYRYRKKYAWAAKDEEDHEARLAMYNGFWEEASSGSFIVLIHRAFTRLKAIPSIMDLTTFNSKGVSKRILNRIVKDINEKYQSFFNDISEEYKVVVYYEQKRILNNLLRVYKTIDPKKIKGEFAFHLKKDLAIIRKYAHADICEMLEKDFCEDNFLKATKSALDHIEPPRVTVEQIFKGKMAIGPRKQLLNTTEKTIMQVEPTSFLNFRYPHKGAEIICDIIKKLKLAKKKKR